MLRIEMRPGWDRVSYRNPTGLDNELDPSTRQLQLIVIVRYQLFSNQTRAQPSGYETTMMTSLAFCRAPPDIWISTGQDTYLVARAGLSCYPHYTAASFDSVFTRDTGAC